MITKLIYTIILLAGMTLTINGVAVKATDIIANASQAAGQANISQFRTALDLYFIDHGNYPVAFDGAGMVEALKNDNYIRENAPVNTDDFLYQIKDNGQNYTLALKAD